MFSGRALMRELVPCPLGADRAFQGVDAVLAHQAMVLHGEAQTRHAMRKPGDVVPASQKRHHLLCKLLEFMALSHRCPLSRNMPPCSGRHPENQRGKARLRGNKPSGIGCVALL